MREVQETMPRDVSTCAPRPLTALIASSNGDLIFARLDAGDQNSGDSTSTCITSPISPLDARKISAIRSISAFGGSSDTNRIAIEREMNFALARSEEHTS